MASFPKSARRALRPLLLASALAFSGDAAAQDATPATAASAGYDVSALAPQIQTAVGEAREAAQRAEDAAERARGAARNGARVRGNAVTNGNGFAQLQNGASYAGQFQNGAFSGFGVYDFGASGASVKYEGQFSGGAMQGDGLYTWRTGGAYAGVRQDGARQGAGVYTFPDGRKYEGQWANDAREGFGVEWSADGRVRQAGRWANNQFAGPVAEGE